MPRRIFTYGPNEGLELGNMISTVGAFFMAIGFLIMLVNIVITTIKYEKVGNDPWGYTRTIEWALPSPPKEYNFKQLPLIRGIDSWWIEQREGKKELTPSEPVGDIHMPNPSIVPFIISFGMFVAAFGAMYQVDGYVWAIPVLLIGGAIVLGGMFVRSWVDDYGYHIHAKDLEDDDNGQEAKSNVSNSSKKKGGKA